MIPNTLVIGDLHIPFEHRDYLEFCFMQYKKYKCKLVISIGDICDNHAISFHDHSADGLSSGQEVFLATKILENWGKAFPKMKICIGNHDELPQRQALSHGISSRFIQTKFNEMWGTPKGWVWDFKHKVGDVLFLHGTGRSGKNIHMNLASENRCKTVVGHAHTVFGVGHVASFHDKIWGMCVGCGINNKAYSFAYGRVFPRKPFLGLGVILENGRVPLPIPMDI